MQIAFWGLWLLEAQYIDARPVTGVVCAVLTRCRRSALHLRTLLIGPGSLYCTCLQQQLMMVLVMIRRIMMIMVILMMMIGFQDLVYWTLSPSCTPDGSSPVETQSCQHIAFRVTQAPIRATQRFKTLTILAVQDSSIGDIVTQ